jgi:hypothetical protein
MKPIDALKIFAGSVAVYVIMAACGGGDGSSPIADGGASLRDVGASLRDVGSSLLDALTEPVKDARADVAQGGSRLKAKYLAGSDGSKQFLFEWNDTLRTEDCKYKAASDGKTRCLPAGLPITYYADDNCSTPLINVLRDCPAGSALASPYAEINQSYNTQEVLVDGGILGRPIACGQASTKTTLYSRGALVTTTPTGFVYRFTGTCTSAGTITSRLTTDDLYALGPEVPPASFVEATVEIEP